MRAADADADLTAELEQEAAARGWPALHTELARVDPATAQRLAPADSQRIQRALEVFRISGQPISVSRSAARSALCGTLASGAGLGVGTCGRS